MKVAELIEQLKDFSPDAEVWIDVYVGDNHSRGTCDIELSGTEDTVFIKESVLSR